MVNKRDLQKQKYYENTFLKSPKYKLTIIVIMGLFYMVNSNPEEKEKDITLLLLLYYLFGLVVKNIHSNWHATT